MEHQSTEALNINYLPAELVKSIVKFVPHEDQRSSVCLVSKLFFNSVGLSHFNLGLVLPSEMEQLVRVFGRYQKPLGLAFNKPHKLSVQDMAHLTSLTQLTCLSAKEAYIDGSTLVHLTNLVSLEADNVKTLATFSIAHLSKLETLNFTNTSNEWINTTSTVVTSLTVKSEASPPEYWLRQFKRLQSLELVRSA